MSLLEHDGHHEPGRFDSEHASRVIGPGPLPVEFTNVIPPVEMTQPPEEDSTLNLMHNLGLISVDPASLAEIRPYYVSTS